MIPIAILLGAGIIGGIGIVSLFWNDLITFLKKAINKVKQLVDGIVYGSKVFIKKFYEGFKEISRHYSKVGETWQETTITKTISADKVPPEILERARYQNYEVDITDELEMQLTSA